MEIITCTHFTIFINGLNSPLKRQGSSHWLSKIQLHAAARDIPKTERQRKVECKRMGTLYQVNTNQNKLTIAIQH